MGEQIYNFIMNNPTIRTDYSEINDQVIIDEITLMSNLRKSENRLFKLLQLTQKLPEKQLETHLKAQLNDENSLIQLETYFRYRYNIEELIDDARHYQKYLKYKQKYNALKNQLKN